MKIVQSFWSGNTIDINKPYGWFSAKYHWIGWILGAHQLSRHHPQVELYTDAYGYEILINVLNLPYSKIHVVLDELNGYDENLWALPKIKTYQLQEAPFIHVDGDVFVWDSLTKGKQDSALIAQNMEITTAYYSKMWDEIKPHLLFVPNEFKDYLSKVSNYACNMGVVGGSDISFFKDFSHKSFDFVDKNKDAWKDISCTNFNIFFEQVLFYQLAKISSKNIDYIFNEISEDNNYVGFGDFDKVPDKTYLHLLGDYKRNIGVCRNMEIYIMKYYPDAYSKLISYLENHPNYSEENLKPTEKSKQVDYRLKDSLMSRDLMAEGVPLLLDRLRSSELPFYIRKYDNFILQDSNEKTVKIYEANGIFTIYEIDEVDELMLKEIQIPIRYDDFVTRMKCYLDNDEDYSEFLLLINNRLRMYISLKIISIYV